MSRPITGPVAAATSAAAPSTMPPPPSDLLLGDNWHREAATLYVDRQEFPNRAALIKRLGRDGSKETTLNYVEPFKERRGIGEIIAPVLAAAKSVTRSRFDGLKLDRAASRDPRIAAIGLLADVKADIDGFKARKQSIPTFHAVDIGKRAAALDAIETGASVVLASAIEHDPVARKSFKPRTGIARATALASAVDRKRKALQDPDVRAARLVARHGRRNLPEI